MDHDEIRRLYHRAEYDTPKLFRVLADVAGITADELKIIIKGGDENMTKWSKEQTDTYERMTAEGKKADEIAAALGVQKQAIYDQRQRDKAKAESSKAVKPERKPAVVNKDFDKEFPKAPIEANTVYAECAPEEPVFDTNTAPIDTVNAKIAKLCELPEPKKLKSDYSESLIETLREALEDMEDVNNRQEEVNQKYYKVIDEQEKIIEQQNIIIVHYKNSELPIYNNPEIQIPGIFYKAQSALHRLKDVAEQNEIRIESITLTINRTVVDVSGGNSFGDCAGWHKKYILTEI